jgi:hypothetical protein
MSSKIRTAIQDVTGGVVAAAMHRNATAAIANVLASVIAARSCNFAVAVSKAKEAESNRVKYWEIIAENLKKRGWSLGYVSALDSHRRTYRTKVLYAD